MCIRDSDPPGDLGPRAAGPPPPRLRARGPGADAPRHGFREADPGGPSPAGELAVPGLPAHRREAMSASTEQRLERLRETLGQRILVLDGAMGTLIQSKGLKAADFGGPELEGCNENLVLTRPELIRDIHRAYFQAGADVTETDTFGGTPLVLGEYALQDLSLI